MPLPVSSPTNETGAVGTSTAPAVFVSNLVAAMA